MAGIFISYRRGDSIGHTGRLFDLLTKHLGAGQVFMDINTIGPGEDYLEVIKKTTESCERPAGSDRTFLAECRGRKWESPAG